MPNSFAYFMLLIWPGIAFLLFRRLPVERALIWSILGAYLILPPRTNFDFPLVPPLDKTSIANLCALLFCTLMLGKRVPVMPESPIARMLMCLLVISPVASALTNPDPILFAVGGLPGLGINDAISDLISQAIAVIPLLLARRFLASEAAQREILIALVVAGLAYSLPELTEIRLAPQLNVWIYGFFQHDFIQMMRQGGFRPIVFLPHGLWVAFFAMMTTVAAFAMWRASPPARRAPFLVAGGYLFVVLVLCKSLGALLYAIFLVPVVMVLQPKTQIRIAALLGLIAVTYPLLRGADLVPVDWMLEQAASVSEDRSASLAVRFNNEKELLDKARQKPLFGWGSWGRNRIYDPLTGQDRSVTDGRWVIVIGTGGWAGYAVEFGLLALPLFLLAARARRLPAERVSPYVGPLALILGFNMIDMLPNATLIPFTWLLAGAILGYAEMLARAGAPGRVPVPTPASSPAAGPVPAEARVPRTVL
ncbi:MAG: hypothetical protein U1E34_00175 [Amaricoccus sp.]